MNNYALSHTRGMSSLWPEINTPFLSLQGIPDHVIASHRIQKIYHELLTGFDALTSCELKEFYKFKLFLQKLDHQVPPCPELDLIVQALRAWVNFDYAHARQLFRQHLQRYPSDVIALFMTHMFDFCTGVQRQLLLPLTTIRFAG